MWVVAIIKRKEIGIFKESFIKNAGRDIQFYCPKIQYHHYFGNKLKIIEKFVLENYIFCYHSNFQQSNFINSLKFLKGLKYFLDGSHQNQNEIVKFIKYCKSFENNKGYLTQSFFKNIITKKAKFISGPFTNMMFEILEKKKNNLKIIVGNVVTTISDKANYLYRPT